MHELLKRGFSVADMASVGNSFPDLVVADYNHTVLIELKEPEGKIYIAQIEFLANWKGYAAFAQTIEDCIRIMHFPVTYSLSQKQKDYMLQIAIRYRHKTTSRNPQIAVSTFDKLMAGEN